MSLTALRKIFRNAPHSELPADLAACLAGNKQAIQANHDAAKIWKKEDEYRRSIQRDHHTGHTQEEDTTHQTVLASMPHRTSQTTPCHPQSSSHTPEHHSLSASKRATVHRTAPDERSVIPQTTASPNSRGKRTLDDPTIQVGSKHASPHTEINSIGLETHLLPPESRTSPTPPNPAAQVNKSKGKGIITPPNEAGPPETSKTTNTTNKSKGLKVPRMSTRIKTNKKATGLNCLTDLDVQSFVDVPLQLAEGTEILALIGATGFHIPSHLIISPHEQNTQMQLSQTSAAQPKKKKTQQNPAQGQQAGQIQIEIAQQYGPTHQDPETDENNQGVSSKPMRQELAQQDDAATNEGGQIDPTEDDFIQGLDDIDEDPYLDRVDYSDEEIEM